MSYFLYCRKSTDREDRQILSPEAQKRLMLEHARDHGLEIAEVYVESQSAYKAGRPLFNEMLRRLETKEADGVLTYHLTRLARNSYDGGRLIYMMDQGLIRHIATPERTYKNQSDDKFLMQIHFAMAKKSSDDTSQFVSRDIDSKLLRGEYPGMVPLGYLNINRDGHISRAQDDMEKYQVLKALGRPLKREEIDPVEGPIVRRLFHEVARRSCSAPEASKLAHRMGLRSRKGRRLGKNAVVQLLTNPYYYGVIRYRGRIHDDETIRELSGNPEASIQHEPLVAKSVFDTVQDTLTSRKKGRYRKHRFSYGSCIIRCGECGGPVTAERQKGHVYYHCTGRRDCGQSKWTREDVLDRQLDEVLRGLRLPDSFLRYALGKLRTVHTWQARSSAAMQRRLQEQLEAAQRQLDKLLDLKLSDANHDGELLSDKEYVRQKAKIRSEVQLIEEQLATLRQQRSGWVEDCERFLDFSQRLARTFVHGTAEDRQTYLNLVCTNLTLKDQILTYAYREPYASLAEFSGPMRGNTAQFEPSRGLLEAETGPLIDGWLGVLDAIRTYPLLKWVGVLAQRTAENPVPAAA